MWAPGIGFAGVFLEEGRNLVVAKAMAGGDGLAYAHLPGNPPAVDLAPLYPIVLSVLWRAWPVFPDNLTLIQILDAAIFGAAAWVVASHARRLPVPAVAVYTTLLLAFVSVPALTLAGSRFSGPLALSLFAGAIWAGDRKSGDLRWSVVAGLLAGLAGLAARAALVVPAGVVLGLLVRRKPREVMATLGAAVVVLIPWGVWLLRQDAPADAWIVENHAAIAATVPPIVEAWGPNVPVVSHFANWILGHLPWWVSYPGGVLLLAAVIVGAAALFRPAPSLVISVALFTLLAAMRSDLRLNESWIVLPWFGLFAAAGAVRAWAANRRTRWAVLTAVGLILIGYVPHAVVGVAGRTFDADRSARSRSVATLVGSVVNETPEEGIVAVAAAELVYLYTGRSTIPPPLIEPGDSTALAQLADRFCDRGVTHVASLGRGFFGTSTDRLLLPASALSLVFELYDGQALHNLKCRD
jgi:hypothetical protein